MAKDPYRYFRIEAKEILDHLAQGILELEKSGAGSETYARLLRLAHTLKGAARVVGQPTIAEIAHAAEGVLASHRESDQPLSPQQASELLSLVDEITASLRTLDPVSMHEETPAATRVPQNQFEMLRVDADDMDSLLRGITEMSVRLGGVKAEIAAEDRLRDLTRLLAEQLSPRPGGNGSGSAPAMLRARSIVEELRSDLDNLWRALHVKLERVDAELAEVRNTAYRLRLVPARTVFPSLDRTVRDAAQELARRVEFEVSGGEVRLDPGVLAALRDALVHVVRNAVVHGIESEGERVAAGKSPIGRVRVDVERRGRRIALICRDDGKGIDIEAVKEALIARGVVSASEGRNLGADQVLDFLRGGGVTTSGQVTELSGRGIGLDVVRDTVSRLKGKLSIRSDPGHGATIEIVVPVSLASLAGLVVETAGTVVTIPLDAVQETLPLRETDVSRGPDGDSIVYEGVVIPYLPLERALWRRGRRGPARQTWSAVVVQAQNRRVALGVDRMMGTAHVVMQALPTVVEADPVVSGASLDAEGNPQLVLDPHGLVAAAGAGFGMATEEVPQRPPPILVIDDSLTTRMLEQSILQSAGYDVALAVSGEEGLAKAREESYGLFLVDVEMPGMNGFEFLETVRADPILRAIPAILVTSLDSPDNRRRGEQAGARAYIAKGEFDQGVLLNTIRALIG